MFVYRTNISYCFFVVCVFLCYSIKKMNHFFSIIPWLTSFYNKWLFFFLNSRLFIMLVSTVFLTSIYRYPNVIKKVTYKNKYNIFEKLFTNRNAMQCAQSCWHRSGSWSRRTIEERRETHRSYEVRTYLLLIVLCYFYSSF